jgi:pyrroloquinoline quinone (PQQ) biosynthesis protein C
MIRLDWVWRKKGFQNVFGNLNIISEVGNAVKKWRREASRLGLSKAEINRMESAFEHEDLKYALSI